MRPFLMHDVRAAPTTPARSIDVDFVIPAYDEAANLERSVLRPHRHLCERFAPSWQITIADNASRDDTWEIACRLADSLDGVRAVHLDRKGRGRALRAAWSASHASTWPGPRSRASKVSGGFAASSDSDNSISPSGPTPRSTSPSRDRNRNREATVGPLSGRPRRSE